jgi:hypothetical protein
MFAAGNCGAEACPPANDAAVPEETAVSAEICLPSDESADYDITAAGKFPT